MPSQYKEDEFLRSYFMNKRNGCVVDIGAADGTLNSNSDMLIRDFGFMGFLVEPGEQNFKALSEKYKGNDKIALANVACAEDDLGEVDFYVDNLDGTNQLSTLSVDQAAHCKDYFKCGFEKTKVQVVKTDSLFSLHLNPHISIDFLSIDTESYDLSVLKGIDFDKYDILLICIENDTPEIWEFLTGKGYFMVHRTEGNLFWEKL